MPDGQIRNIDNLQETLQHLFLNMVDFVDIIRNDQQEPIGLLCKIKHYTLGKVKECFRENQLEDDIVIRPNLKRKRKEEEVCFKYTGLLSLIGLYQFNENFKFFHSQKSLFKKIQKNFKVF